MVVGPLGSGELTVTSKLSVTVAPDASVPTLKITRLPTVSKLPVPCDAVILPAYVVFVGMGFVTTTEVALAAPLFASVSV